ncbi:MAG TPA: hypothetical protein VNR61_16545 [Niallia sp.]|nr:hypothetical protein [Niallia sp.]
MKKENVLYNGKIFTIIFCYETGFCEIRDINNRYKVELVHQSQLTRIQDQTTSLDNGQL